MFLEVVPSFSSMVFRCGEGCVLAPAPAAAPPPAAPPAAAAAAGAAAAVAQQQQAQQLQSLCS